ncbi:KdpE [Dehalogenimonas sp. WBC-2]|nr:KdpE [Dehalogenimonas sp. WBC-2]
MQILAVEASKADIEAMDSIFKVFWPGVSLVTEQTGQGALAVIGQQMPQLIILDLVVPGTDCFGLIKEIRLFSTVPLIVIDSERNESSLIRSFELGADDYITKPLRPLELLVRAKAIMRRVQGIDCSQYIVAGLLRLHASLHMAYLGEQEVRLTRTENIILRHLMENAGHTVTHSSLSQKIWGDDSTDASATLRVYIERLRKKLGDDPKNPALIQTETGLGYRLIKTNA